MDGLVSVIIPVYNREKYIKECIKSVTAQSYQSFEIIVIDDGSTDNTLQICQNLAENDERIRLISAGHNGVSGARNLGLDAACGEFLFFIDSDDVIHPKLFEVLIDTMKSTGADIANTTIANVSEGKWSLVYDKMKQDNSEEAVYLNHSESMSAVFHNKSPLQLIGGAMLRRALVGDTRFRTDLFIGEDFYFLYQNLIKGASTAFTKQKWYYCRMHSSSLSCYFDFDAFRSRFLRRKLVWESEEHFGRDDYARLQKRNSFHVFERCIKRSLSEADSKKMRDVMKSHKKLIFSALTFKEKLRFIVSVHMPAIYKTVSKKTS